MGSEEASSQGSLEEAGYRYGRVTGPRREALGPAKTPEARRPCRAVPARSSRGQPPSMPRLAKSLQGLLPPSCISYVGSRGSGWKARGTHWPA